MWGKWIDQENGAGNDSPEAKWLIGEDRPGGAFRDMANPPAHSDPDRLSSPCGAPLENTVVLGDAGGVHTNCGIGHKLCYLLTDGDTFNGYTVKGMGIDRIADLFYEVQTNLLTSGADYIDLNDTLAQAAINLGWTSSERENLHNACLGLSCRTKGNKQNSSIRSE